MMAADVHIRLKAPVILTSLTCLNTEFGMEIWEIY